MIEYFGSFDITNDKKLKKEKLNSRETKINLKKVIFAKNKKNL